MERHVLFYGNCQVGALAQILAPSLSSYKIIFCWADIIQRECFLDEIQKARVIITQPIHEGYRGKDYLHTGFVLENSRDAVIIIFPSLHFDFYYFDLTYRWNKNKEIIREPSDYHYKTLVEYFQAGKTAREFIKEVCDNPDFEGATPPPRLAERSLEELERREKEMSGYSQIGPCHIVTASSFIRDHYRDDLLFFSMNHPTKLLFHHIANRIVGILSPGRRMPMNLEIDPLRGNERGILYRGIQKYVNFDTEHYLPRLTSKNLDDKAEIVEAYLESYRQQIISDQLP